MPRKRLSAWKSWLTYWLPWSWRSCRPAATSLANAPQRSRTACLTGSSAPKRAARRLAWAPSPRRWAWGAALGGGVGEADDPRGPAPAGHHRGRVGPPHQVDPVRGDRAVVGPRAVPTPGTPVRQQAVLTREPQDAAPAGADPREAQPRPQLAIALTVEGAVLQQLPDLPDQGLVRHRADRPRPPPLAAIRAAVAVDGRPRHAPQARDPLDPVRLGGGGRGLPAHRLDLLRAKGRPASSRSTLAPSSPFPLGR